MRISHTFSDKLTADEIKNARFFRYKKLLDQCLNKWRSVYLQWEILLEAIKRDEYFVKWNCGIIGGREKFENLK